MSAQSKIISPVYVSSGSDPASVYDNPRAIWSPTPSPDQKTHRALLGQRSGIPSGSVTSRSNRFCCPSASGSNIHQPRHPLASMSRQKQRFHSYVSASPGYDDTESQDLLMLRAENESLKEELDRL